MYLNLQGQFHNIMLYFMNVYDMDVNEMGSPLSAHFMYLNNVLRWPEDGHFIAETCRYIIN